jgi:hypothetical protein
MIRIILSALALVVCCESASALPCLSREQAIATGKHAKYRQVTPDRRCWYVTKHTPSKSEFTLPRAMVAAKPARTETQETRAQVVPVGSIPAAGALSHQDMMEDAFLALTGKPESSFTFDAYWNRMTGWGR